MVHNIIPTCTGLLRKGLEIDDSCSVYGLVGETLRHILCRTLFQVPKAHSTFILFYVIIIHAYSTHHINHVTTLSRPIPFKY